MYCFVAGSLVTTEDGQKPIEEIQVGDKVLSEDETTGEVAVKTVTETYVNETDELVHIGVNGETISATPSHPFYEKHHGIMDKWASENIHGYTKSNAPTILLSDTNHGKTKGVYNTWKAEKFGTNPVDWKNVSSAKIRELSEKMFDAASIPISTRNEYYELFDLFPFG